MMKKRFINGYETVVKVLLYIGLGFLIYYISLASSGVELLFKPYKNEIRVDVINIANEDREKNYRDSKHPLYATSQIQLDNTAYHQIENFGDYIAYAKKHNLNYYAEYLYTEDPGKKSNTHNNIKYMPMAFDTSQMSISLATLTRIEQVYKFPTKNLIEDGNDGNWLLLTADSLTFQPFNPHVSLKTVTLKYKDSKLQTPLWVSQEADEKDSDIDYIITTDNIVSYFKTPNRWITEPLAETIYYSTYKKRGLGFASKNQTYLFPGVIKPSSSDHYVIADNLDSDEDDYVHAVLYLTITNEKTQQEKTFRKVFNNITVESENGKETQVITQNLVRLITGNWDYTYNH